MKAFAMLAVVGLLGGCACAQVGKMQHEEAQSVKARLMLRAAQPHGTARLNTAEASVPAGTVHPSR